MPQLTNLKRLMNPEPAQVAAGPGDGTSHLLLEDGFDLQLEDGSQIMLEIA